MGEENLERKIADILTKNNREEIREFELAKGGFPINPFPSYRDAYEIGIAVWLKERKIGSVNAHVLVNPDVLYGFKIEVQRKIFQREYIRYKKEGRVEKSGKFFRKFRDITELIGKYVAWTEAHISNSHVQKEWNNFLLGKDVADKVVLKTVEWKEEQFQWTDEGTALPDDDFMRYVRQIGIKEDDEEMLSRWCQLYDGIEEERNRRNEDTVITLNRAYHEKSKDLFNTYAKGEFIMTFRILDDLQFLLKAIVYEISADPDKELPLQLKVRSKADFSHEQKKLDRVRLIAYETAEQPTGWVSTMRYLSRKQGDKMSTQDIDRKVAEVQREMDCIDSTIYLEIGLERDKMGLDLDILYEKAVNDERFLDAVYADAVRDERFLRRKYR